MTFVIATFLLLATWCHTKQFDSVSSDVVFTWCMVEGQVYFVLMCYAYSIENYVFGSPFLSISEQAVLVIQCSGTCHTKILYVNVF